ncbi:PIN domain-containing protein [Nitratireductor soli]|uniref:PIN domain-containing protein n=1 Tax=Nitratireductor soli TaxID=1670619 RepID=UPI00065DD5C7|nr:type II toxin-antitoxin system VapC family toxin [Nitratireductor soli]
MIGIDTNVLLRFLVVDHAGQVDVVRDFFANRSGSDPVFVSAIVLLEALWVLKRRFGYTRSDVAAALRQLLSSPEFEFEHGERLTELLSIGDPSSSDIADRLIAESGKVAGCSRTVTFDRSAAARIPGMELLS